jgi:hypothetical protein
MSTRRALLLLPRAVAVALVAFNEAASFRATPLGPESGNPCSVPDEVRAKAEVHGMVLLRAASTHVVYGVVDGAEDGLEEEETSLLIFDCLKKKELIFLHIPKNAGTSIEDQANEQGTTLGRFHDKHGGLQETGAPQTMPDGNQCSWWHVPPWLKAPPNPYADPNSEVFCVTRDPWLRTRSEYVYLLATYNKWPKPYVKDAPQCTVEGLNTWALRSLQQYEAGQPYLLDCHMLPQWSFIEGPDARRWCHTLLPIAELTPKFNALMQSRGLPIRMAPHSKVNSQSSFCPELSAAPVASVFLPPLRAVMQRVYKKDLQHLGSSLVANPPVANASGVKN